MLRIHKKRRVLISHNANPRTRAETARVFYAADLPMQIRRTVLYATQLIAKGN
jgi:hypothetical protein